MIHHLFTRRQIASVMLASYLMGPALAFAQVVINGGTPNDDRRAYVDQTQNGLPKVNIATPNGAGVSHNVYQEFNVGKQGLILNNGANNSNTTLAGWVEGNPNLTPGNEAKMILNEVVGTTQSQLQGFLEVAGKKADVIIANENGVTCNGCGFINTNRVTLSTSTPVWGSGGQLDGLKVRQGAVVIGSEGLSAPDSRVDLLSQVINIQGSIHADKINVVAGGNDIRYDDLSLTKQADIKGTLDIAALGGMYANQIQLVATGTGVGVRVDGTLISAGNVSITSDGQLINTGGINAQAQLKTQAVNLENSGTLNGQTLDLTSDKVLNLGAGTVASSSEAAIHATRLNNLGRIHTEGKATLDTRRVNNAGVIEATGGLEVSQAWTVQNSGTLSGTNVAVNTQVLSNSGRVQAEQFTLSSYQDASIATTDKLAQTAVTNSGLIAASQIAITGFGRVTNTNQISTDIAASGSANPSANSGNLRIQADTLDNTGGSILAKNKLAVDTGNVYNNRATLSSKGDLSITASGNIDNGEGLVLHQGAGTAQVQAGLALNNVKGQIEGQGQNLTVSAGDIDNTQGQIIQTKLSTDAQPATLNVTAQAGVDTANTPAAAKGQLVNIKGKISSTGNGTVTANSIVTDPSSAQLSGNNSLIFLDKSKANSGASTSTAGYNWEADIAAANAVTQAQAAVDAANADVTNKAAALQTAQANLAALRANTASTPAAITQAQNDVTAAQTASDSAAATAAAAAQQLAAAIAAVPVINEGASGSGSATINDKPDDMSAPVPPVIVLNTPASQIQAGNDLTLNIGTGLLDNRQGSLAAGDNLTVNAQGDVLAGQMTAGNALSVTAKQLEVDQQIRGRTADVKADKLVVTGRVQGDDSLTIKADSITNSGTLTGKVTTLQGRSSDTMLELGNTGMVQGNQSLSITANKVLNQATLASGGDITTQTQYLENQALIYSGGHQKLYGVELVNNGGRIHALGDIIIQGNAAGDNAGSVLNYVGRIEAQGDINLKANTIINRAVVPTVNTRGVVEKRVTPTLITTTARDAFNADGKTSEILAGKNININADELNNEYGIISARLNANIGTRLLTNRAYGAIQTQNYVAKAACFNCHQTVSYSETWGGVIAAGGTATVTASEKLDNKTIDTRDGFAGLSTDPRVVIVDERSNTASPLTQAFKDRFGIVNGPANSATGSAPSLNLGSPKALSDGIVLNPNGTFDFSHYTVPNGQTGLFEKAPATSPYLIRGRSDLYSPATNGQYTSYDKFAGSDYLLTRLGLMPSGVKLLGDAWYETQLVQDQMYALKGRTHLVAGTDNDYDLLMGLMDAGLLAQAQLGFGLGDSLSAAQQAALTQDMVWPEWQVVDGQKVLVPKLYVAHLDTNNDNNKGARILGTDVAITTRELENTGTLAASNSLAINASGKVSGGGSYSGGKTVAIVADSVELKSASIQSGGWLSIDTANDLTLTATQIKADGDARLSAGGTVALNADKHEAHIVRGDGSSKDEVRYETTNVSAGGNLTIEGTKGVVVQGSKLDAGEDIKLSSTQGNVDLQAVVDSENVNIKGARGGGLLGGLLSALTGNTTQTEAVKDVQINAGGSALVQAAKGDVSAQSLQLHADEQAAIVSGGVVKLTSAQAYSKVRNGTDVRQSLVTERSEITGDKSVTIYGKNSVQIDAANVKAAQGDVNVLSAGNVSLGFNTDTQQHNWTTSSTSGNPIKSKTTVTQHETLDKTAQVTELQGQNVKVLGYNVKSEGAKMDGSQLVQVEGVNNTQLYAVQELHQVTTNSQTSSGIMGFTYSKSSSSDSSIKSEALGTRLSSDKAVQVGVGAVTDVQGAILTAPKVNFLRSAGADTNKDGQLILGGSTNTTQTSHAETTNTAGVWQAQSGHGETSQTYNQTQINGQVNIATGIRTTVLIPEGDLKNQIEALSQRPGQVYIGELAKDPRINWQQVKLAYDKWDYSTQGLTPAGAALLAIAVAVASGGSAASLVSSMGYSGATAAAMTAGLTTLASSAAVSFVNNGGDLGKTLHDMGSSQNIKGIALAMVSAGVLSELNSTMGLDKVKVTDGFTANLNKAIVNNLANATMTSAITGTPLEDNIKTGLVSAFISAGSGQAANTIGDMTANDQMAKALAHAIAGCVAGAAGQGSGGCSAGATGAVVGELAAQWYDPNGTKKPEDTLNFVKVVTAAAAAITGDGSAASVSTAVMTGVNAAQNNYLAHVDAQRRAQLAEQCKTGCSAALREELAKLEAQDKQSDTALRNACSASYGGDAGSAACGAEYSKLVSARASYGAWEMMTPKDWLNEAGNAGKVVQFIRAYDPKNNADLTTSNRDKLTGMPLDATGRYTVSAVIDGELYKPKYLPCATTECVRTGSNLDMSDAGTRAYVRALDKKIMDDINNAATVTTVVSPVGVAGNIAGAIGPVSSIASGIIADEKLAAVLKEGLQAGATKYLMGVHKFSEDAAKRFVAAVDLAGGWQGFVTRVTEVLNGEK